MKQFDILCNLMPAVTLYYWDWMEARNVLITLRNDSVSNFIAIKDSSSAQRHLPSALAGGRRS